MSAGIRRTSAVRTVIEIYLQGYPKHLMLKAIKSIKNDEVHDMSQFACSWSQAYLPSSYEITDEDKANAINNFRGLHEQAAFNETVDWLTLQAEHHY